MPTDARLAAPRHSNRMRPLRIGWVSLALLAAVLPPAAAAQGTKNHLYDRFQAVGSVSLLAVNSIIALDHPGDGTPGSEVDAERVLGLSPTVLEPHFALRWRPGRRHELELGVQVARRSADKVLIDEVFEFGEETFDAGLNLDTHLRTDHLFLNYRFAILARERAQAGLALGLGVFRLNERVGATTYLHDGADSVALRLEEAKHLPGPTVSLGVFGRVRAGEGLYLEGDLRAMYARFRDLAFISLRRLDATVMEGGGSARYFLTSGLGAELGYNLGLYRATLASGDLFDSHDDSDAKFHYTVHAFRAGVVLAF